MICWGTECERLWAPLIISIFLINFSNVKFSHLFNEFASFPSCRSTLRQSNSHLHNSPFFFSNWIYIQIPSPCILSPTTNYFVIVLHPLKFRAYKFKFGVRIWDKSRRGDCSDEIETIRIIGILKTKQNIRPGQFFIGDCRDGSDNKRWYVVWFQFGEN